MELLFLKPILKKMIWGEECWGISAHPNGDCTVINKEKTLSYLWKEEPTLFGNIKQDRFPLLVKTINAKEDLSIQVHPDDVYARAHENGSLGKTECWYVLECKENATIVIGHHAKTQEEVKEMILNERWTEFINEIPIKKGDFFQINPGCLHAIKGGTVILETQENSDITYRVYDYDRLTEGKPRELHVQKSIEVIKTNAQIKPEKPRLETGKGYKKDCLIQCDYYEVHRILISKKARFTQDKPFLNVSIIDGFGKINGISIKKGDYFIIPYAFGDYTFEGEMTLITSSL